MFVPAPVEAKDRVFTILYVTSGFVFVYAMITAAVDAFFESVMKKVKAFTPERGLFI